MTKSINQNKKVPWGRTLKTNDKYLSGSKTGSAKERPIVAVDSKENGEILAVPLSSTPGKNKTHLPNYQDGKSYFKHFIESKDNEGNPIVTNEKFKQNHTNMDVSVEDVKFIRQKLLNNVKQKQRNQKIYKDFHKK